jgi:putative membrane protein
MSFSDLPAVNASLNAFSGILLMFGLRFIIRGNIQAHRKCMIGACCSSLLFLVCYLTYHTWMRRTHGTAHTTFLKPPEFRPIYLTILYTHLVAAIVILPMVLITLFRALKGNFDRHKKIARWTWPLWMYVSVTGVIIYLLLYQIFPQR